MSEYKTIIDHIVVDGASHAAGGYDDWVDLAGILSAVIQAECFSRHDLRRVSLEVVREILTTGLMDVGVLSPDMTRFVPWRVDTNDALARIEEQWRALGRDPTLWEICWFANTTAGNERARASGLISP